MKYAAIDIGTNTVLCLIGDVSEDLVPLADLADIARLGEGLAHSGVLNPQARQRTLAILENYCKAIKHHGVPSENVRIIATAGMRRASNAQDFITEVKQRTGFNIEVIDGDREAFLNYLAVRCGLNLPPSMPLLIMDIGGGSTEIVTTRGGKILTAKSLQLGSVWLTETFFKHEDPPSSTAYQKAEQEIHRILKEAKFNWQEHSTMIGIAGTITTLCAMDQRMEIYDPKKVHGSKLQFSTILSLEKTLLHLTLSEKIKLPGLQKERADVLLAGAMIARIVMQQAGIEALTVSDQGIRYGLLWEIAQGGG